MAGPILLFKIPVKFEACLMTQQRLQDVCISY